MKTKQEKLIKEVMKKRKESFISILLNAASSLLQIEKPAIERALVKGGYTISSWEGITSKLLDEYSQWLDAGGTMCVEEFQVKLDNGKVMSHPVHKFVPWLDDMEREDAREVIRIIKDGEKSGLHPRKIAKNLKGVFEGTYHNAVTAARTEAQKIRTDARFKAFQDQGIRYVQYVTARDERVRPLHRLRNGKIYRVQDAPWLGEYNCRCTLVPADYQVLMEGKHVEVSDYEEVPA